ncbi:hypothetical protein D9619_010789 [Psilocybe cf. subviscida]|uniref:Uncharacterized protein n=1 Tax=Psilocybe cf. subviscida TaxID=2480587 RepID=A0A8H5B8L4_9AGAR|nr:hypothetical protein D9619_010789 [Psilocybe cf. subviscida]
MFSYLLHSLRLQYLRDVEDPYGPRIISFEPSDYKANPYAVAAGLADVSRCPQLAQPVSPNISDDEQDRPLGFPGARLKHTQTIMGGRSGGAGIRVSGKRVSTSKRASRQLGLAHKETSSLALADGEPALPALAETHKILESQSAPSGDVWIAKEDVPVKEPAAEIHVQQATAPEEVPAPVAQAVQFIPKFKGAAEMEARRRVRMAARRGPMARAPPPKALSFNTSSEEDEPPKPTPIDSSDEVTGNDEFDPIFAATRSGESVSEAASLHSAGTGASVSQSTQDRTRARLSPVSEYIILTAPPPPGRQRKTEAPPDRTRADSASSIVSNKPPPLFARRPVTALPSRPAKSSLSAMLAAANGSANPFSEAYAGVSGRGAARPFSVRVFFPQSADPEKAMKLEMRGDATVEEALGHALYMYWEDGRLPRLDQGLSGEEDPKWADRMSTVGWVLRIAEDDGEVDDDFPPPDRLEKASKFASEAYAILEATPAQIQQNRALEAKIQRATPITKKLNAKPSQFTLGSTATAATQPSLAATSTSVLGTSSLGPSAAHGPQIFLRIHTADAVHISTTIPVTAGMYMQEALELVCRKRKLLDPNSYALLLPADKRNPAQSDRSTDQSLVVPPVDRSIVVPLDRTVASLQGKRELLLVKKSVLPQMNALELKGVGRTTDPNTSIFKRMSDTPEKQASSVLDPTSAYKKYTIYRKLPMLVTRQERTLAIDGDYIHIMPSANKARAVFDSGKTTSYHIKSIADCQQSAKSSALFKIILHRGAGTGSKRYDFEAENPKVAGEIVQTVKGLKAVVERSGTLSKNKPRRTGRIV